MSILYLLQFFAIGTLFPLWPLYYQGLGLSGKIVGLLLSVTPVLAILMPPLWGFLGDRFRLHLPLLLVTSIGAGVASLAVPYARGLALLFGAAGLLAAFQSAWSPIADSIALDVVHREGAQYGRMRLWGSVGFAVASLAAGAAAGRWGLQVIFPLFALSSLASALLVPGLPSPHYQSAAKDAAEKGTATEAAGTAAPGAAVAPPRQAGWRQLLGQPAFAWLLLANLFITGGFASNNYFFGLLYQQAGGGLQGIGLAFLLFALSEVPIMLGAQALVDRYGPSWVLFGAAILAGLRWFLYAMGLAPWQLLATFPLQGLTGGVFIAVGPVLVSRLAPSDLKATALALFGVAGFGLGAIFTASVGGVILDQYGPGAIYAFLGGLAVLGTAALIMVTRLTGERTH